MLVVATEDFEVYHGVVTELRDRGVAFTTVEPPEVPAAEAVVTGPDDEVAASEATVVRAEPGEPRRAVDAALGVLRGDDGRTIVGIDPGDRPGIVVLSGGRVVAAFQVPLAEAADVVAREVEGSVDPVVRVGDGARLQGATLVEDLPDVPVELVDETGTTPHLGTGGRGMGDVLAAVNIARREGEPIASRDVEPTPGELQVIQERSREQSPENREIDAALARRVAKGELTVAEALAEHRGE